MRLGDLNKNNIRLGNSRTIGTGGIGYETSSPTNYGQSIESSVGDDEEDEEDVIDIEDAEEFNKFIDITKSYTPSRSVPDIRKQPNTANLL